MRLILSDNGKMTADSLPLAVADTCDVDVGLIFQKETPLNKDEKLLLSVCSGEAQGCFAVDNGWAVVPQRFFDGEYVVFGCAVIKKGVTMKKWQSEPFGIKKESFGFTVTDDFRALLERVTALETQVEKLRKAITGYSVL